VLNEPTGNARYFLSVENPASFRAWVDIFFPMARFLFRPLHGPDEAAVDRVKLRACRCFLWWCSSSDSFYRFSYSLHVQYL
jgi:hypothetical protein